MDDMVKAAWMFDLEFHLPPFEGNPRECSIDIHKIKDKPEFQTFIEIINHMDIPYEYAKGKQSGRFFLIINSDSINGV